MNKEEAAEWTRIVDALPEDWFGEETHGIFVQYCRHVETANFVAGLVNAMMEKDRKDFRIKDYDRLLKIQERESRIITALGRSMRFTQQSTYSAMKGKGTKRGKPPWES